MNRKMKTGLAVTMAAAMGSLSVWTASAGTQTEESSENAVSKEETVYVNADASGTPQQITVSSWLKNAGLQSSVEDESDLTAIKNIKGDETFRESEGKLIWNTAGSDICYQGQSDKELPVSVSFTYILDGQEMKPQELVGKSGHLQIKIQYTNNEKRSAKVDGKKETIYSPFVMMTALIFPDDTFSNVTIDNGKILSDGSRTVAVGIGMPGLKESLKLDTISFSGGDDSEQGNAGEKALDIDIPDSVLISADVTDFSMGASFTIALSDLLKDVDLDDDGALDDIRDALDELADAATQLVEGTTDLYDGVSELDEKYGEFDDGVKELRDGTHDLADGVVDLTDGVDSLADGAKKLASGAGDLVSGAKSLDDGAGQLQNGAAILQGAVNAYTGGVDLLNAGIQANLSKSSELNTKAAQFAAGINTLAAGVNSYTAGSDALADGITAYVAGEQQLSAGAQSLTQIQSAVNTLSAALDGQGEITEDLVAASNALAEGTAMLTASLGSDQTQQLMTLLDGMLQAGNELIDEAGALSAVMQEQIVNPVQDMMAQADALKNQISALSSYAVGIAQAVDGINQEAAAANAQIQAANEQIAQRASQANTQLEAARQSLFNQASSARQDGNEELAAALEAAAGNITGVDDSQIAGVNAIDIAVPTLSPDDLAAMDNALAGFSDQITRIQTTVSGLMTSLKDVQTKISAITAMKEQIPTDDVASLSAGVDTLNTSMQTFNAAMNGLSASVNELNTKSSTGIQSLLDGFAQLDANNDTLTGAAAQLKEGSASLTGGAEALQSGAGQLIDGLNQLSTQLTAGAGQLAANSQSLRNGAVSLTSGIDSLKSGTTTLSSGSADLKSGTDDLKKGTDDLKSGVRTLADGVSDLKDGADTLSDASDDVTDGISELKDGSEQLKDGMQEFYEEGIRKLEEIAEEAEDDLTVLLDRFKALTSDQIAYDTYSGRNSNMDGTVKFIIETEEIE